MDDIMEDLEAITKKWMNKEGINKYDIRVDGKTEKGDNYACEVIFFCVSTTEDERREFDVILKIGKQSEEIRKFLCDGKLYKRELYMYNEIFPLLTNFLKEVNPSVELKTIPKVFYTCHDERKEAIIMENLRSRGFRLWDRTKPMDLAHVLLVLENYGKYHGASMALHDQKPELFKKSTESMDNVMGNVCNNKEIFNLFQKLFRNAVSILEKNGRGKLARILEPFESRLEHEIIKIADEEDRSVITHGDCWNNNLMFQYKDAVDAKPQAMYFLDFQLASVDSPIKDLGYYIYTACDENLLNQFDLLLEKYYDALKATMTSLGSSLEKFLTIEKLRKDWPKYAIFGLAMASSIVKLQISSREDLPDFENITHNEADMDKVFNYRSQNEDVYEKRILDIFTHFASCVESSNCE